MFQTGRNNQSKNRQVSSVSLTSHGLEEADLWMFILHKSMEENAKAACLNLVAFSVEQKHIKQAPAWNICSVKSMVKVSITWKNS